MRKSEQLFSLKSLVSMTTINKELSPFSPDKFKRNESFSTLTPDQKIQMYLIKKVSTLC